MKNQPKLHATYIGIAQALSLSVISIGCDHGAQPRTITATNALQTANQNLRAILSGSAKNGTLVNDSRLASSGIDAVGAMSSMCTSVAGGGTTCTKTMIDLQQSADHTADQAADKIFNEANIESSEPTKVVLRLKPEELCKTGKAPPEPALDPNCVDALTKVPIRLAITSYAENDVDVALLIGDERANPITLYLHHDEIAIEIDLAGAKSAVSDLLAATHRATTDLPRVMLGKIKLAIHKNGDNDFTASVAIESAVSIAGTSSSEGDYDLEIAEANPATSVRLDGNARAITVETSWNAISLALPFDLIADHPRTCTSGTTNCTEAPRVLVPGTFKVSLAGLTGKTVVTPSDDAIRVTGVGLGPDALRVTLDDNPLLTFDLNANDGRKLDLVLSGANDDVTMKLTPKLDARADFAFKNANGKLSGIDPWMLDETIQAILDGAPEPTLFFKGGSSSFVKVLAGTFTLSSRAEGKTVTATEGMCLVDSMSQDQDPVAQISAATCPM
jgi:hypothetical protein